MSDQDLTAGETDITEDVEHHLGGVATALAGFEARARPQTARYVVDSLDAKDGAIVTLRIDSDDLTGKTFLEPEQARALGARLQEYADEAEEMKADDSDE